MSDRVLDRLPQIPRTVEQVAILVTDVVGSTELARAVGDDRFFDLMARHHAVVRYEAQRGRALSIKLQGDGCFVVFASADAALVAAQAIQCGFADWPVATRAGVHVGPAIAADGDYYGLALNLAAHIGDRAGGGQVLVSDAAVAAATARFCFGRPRDVWVRGEPVRLHDLLWRPTPIG
jgi:class 3 adenylate cyclase